MADDAKDWTAQAREELVPRKSDHYDERGSSAARAYLPRSLDAIKAADDLVTALDELTWLNEHGAICRVCRFRLFTLDGVTTCEADCPMNDCRTALKQYREKRHG